MFIFLDRLTAPKLQLLLILIIILGLLINNYGYREIYWRFTKELYQLYSIFSQIILTANLFISIFFTYLRCNNLINTKYNKTCIYLVYLVQIFNLIGTLIIIISYKNVYECYNNYNDFFTKYNVGRKSILDHENSWMKLNFSNSVTIFCYLLQFPVWISLLYRLKLKVDGDIEKKLGYISVMNGERNDRNENDKNSSPSSNMLKEIVVNF